MTLFDTDAQYREKAAIWVVLSKIQLYASLADGKVWRWFAANLPMDLGTGGYDQSDIDVMVSLWDYPDSPRTKLYRAWEVKVGLLHADGHGRSLKAGKTQRMMNQVEAYRDFGIPEVSLLDVYLCETGFMRNNPFPPPVLQESLPKKLAELHRAGFGYRLLPFEFSLDPNRPALDPLRTYNLGLSPIKTTFDVLRPVVRSPRDGFMRLVEKIDDFVARTPAATGGFRQVVFCRACRRLQQIRMRDTINCPGCGDNLVQQF